MSLIKTNIDIVQSIVRDYSKEFIWEIEYVKNDDNTFTNKKFFSQKQKITKLDIEEIINEFNTRLEELKKQKKLLIHDKNISNTEKNFLLNNINFKWLKFILLKNSIYLEAEKAWYDLEENDRKKYLRRVNILQDVIYWPEISSDKTIENNIINHLSELYYKFSDKLTDEEKTLFVDILKKHNPNFEADKKLDKKEKIDKETDKEININDAIKIFQMILDLYWLNDWQIIYRDAGNFKVSNEEKALIVPSKYKQIKLSRLLKLIDHEISVHMLRWDNNLKTLNIFWEWYLESEEWLASVSERQVALWKLKTDSKVTPSMINSWIAENYDFFDMLEILKVYNRLSTKDWSSQEKNIDVKSLDTALRYKRFVSLYEKWANRKEVTYSRWNKNIISILQSNIDIKQFLTDFYFAKLSANDLQFVEWFKKELSIDNSQLKYPIWIWKILYKKLNWKKVILDKLKQEDNRFEIVDNLTTDTKRKVIEILNYIKKL